MLNNISSIYLLSVDPITGTVMNSFYVSILSSQNNVDRLF